MDKFILKSKTIIGALIAMLPQLGILFGFTFTEDDAAFITQQFDAILTAAGGIYAIYGRIKAEGKIRV